MLANLLTNRTGQTDPLYWRHTFSGSPENASPARQLVRCLLADTPIVSDAVIAAGELVANALQHSRSGQLAGSFVVEVSRWHRRAAMSITDDGDRLPSADADYVKEKPSDQPSDGMAENGRGLSIVRTLATSVRCGGDHAGRSFTAEFRW